MTDTLDPENSAEKVGSTIWITIKKGIFFELFQRLVELGGRSDHSEVHSQPWEEMEQDCEGIG